MTKPKLLITLDKNEWSPVTVHKKFSVRHWHRFLFRKKCEIGKLTVTSVCQTGNFLQNNTGFCIGLGRGHFWQHLFPFYKSPFICFWKYINPMKVILLTLFFPLLIVVAVLTMLLSLLEAQIQLFCSDFFLLPYLLFTLLSFLFFSFLGKMK